MLEQRRIGGAEVRRARGAAIRVVDKNTHVRKIEAAEMKDERNVRTLVRAKQGMGLPKSVQGEILGTAAARTAAPRPSCAWSAPAPALRSPPACSAPTAKTAGRGCRS